MHYTKIIRAAYVQRTNAAHAPYKCHILYVSHGDFLGKILKNSKKLILHAYWGWG